MNWEEIRKEFEITDISMKDLADKHGVKPATLRSRKNREKWQRNDATQRNAKDANVATQKVNEEQQPDKRSVRKRSGNPNPKNQFSGWNAHPNFKHGLFSKYLPDEQIEIIDLLEGQSLADQLWLQIKISFSSIIRLQKIMFVSDQSDDSRAETGSSWGEGGNSETHKHIFAFEKYESYIKAQTRAMAEHRNLIKQFISMADEEDERRLKLEMMGLQVQKADLELDELKRNMLVDDGQNDDDGFISAIDNSLNDVWGDNDG